ncbi:MAG: nicotinate-nucleotide adenylyltransferase [Eubacterium sp.]|nr:nicotinate-nucleotide adenylyltransferase [Eubacterium sp.]
MGKMRRIGVFGGSFDPIHLGHMGIARAARDELGLDLVLFIPALIPPHKLDRKLLAPSERLELVETAIAGERGFAASDMEIRKSAVSFSYLTLRELKSEYPEAELYFIMGADSLLDFDTWKRPEEISTLAHLLVAVRNEDGEKTRKLERKAAELADSMQTRVTFLNCPWIPISSREIRDAFAEGHEQSVRQYMDEDVFDYILRHGFYRTPQE